MTGGPKCKRRKPRRLPATGISGPPPQPGETRILTLLHGTGDVAASFDRFGAALAEGAGAPGLGRLSLQGDVAEFGAARFFRRKGEGVYDMEDLAARTEKLDRFLGRAFEAYGVDGSAAIGVGYSNGANILANLAFERPRRLRRLALLHPLIPFEPPKTDLSGLRVLIAAGRLDPISPAPQTQTLAEMFALRGAMVDLVWSPGGHELSAAAAEATQRFVAEAR